MSWIASLLWKLTRSQRLSPLSVFFMDLDHGDPRVTLDVYEVALKHAGADFDDQDEKFDPGGR
jgi:hypothetical protein